MDPDVPRNVSVQATERLCVFIPPGNAFATLIGKNNCLYFPQLLKNISFYRYGNTCELNCPFGHVDGTCHTQPIDGPEPCICANDQMICDHIKGCICKENGDCGGGQRLLDLTRAAPLDQDTLAMSHSSTVAIVLSVLFLTLATVILIVIYYRRRMKRMKQDLANRSVYYVENSILDQSRHHNHDLVITDTDPIDNNAYTDPTITVFQNNVPNNVAAASSKVEKNVNIDRFKLGYDPDEQTQGASCSAGACAMESSEDEEPIPLEPELQPRKNMDINVFEEESPSKEKNNFLLDNSRKINKPTVDLVFHRNNLALNQKEDEGRYEEIEDEEQEDDITIAKMTAFVNQNHHQEH